MYIDLCGYGAFSMCVYMSLILLFHIQKHFIEKMITENSYQSRKFVTRNSLLKLLTRIYILIQFLPVKSKFPSCCHVFYLMLSIRFLIYLLFFGLVINEISNRIDMVN